MEISFLYNGNNGRLNWWRVSNGKKKKETVFCLLYDGDKMWPLRQQ